ncbi:MAG: DUF721 domain-containing protein [Verrucomicrobiota bacterium]
MKFSKATDDLIADFLGLPRNKINTSRNPVRLENLLVVLEEQYKLEKPSPERVLVEKWEEIFGVGLAARCHPVRIKNDTTLVVSVTNQTLRAELQFRKRSILEKIQRLDHCGAITELVIRS